MPRLGFCFRTDGALGTSGSFVIDTTLGRETQFSVVVEESDDYFIKSVTFTDSKGQSYGPYSSLTNDFNVINVKTINFPQDIQSPPFDDVSISIALLPWDMYRAIGVEDQGYVALNRRLL